MVLEEFLPLLARRGLATDRVGLMGWSMGGYAALRLGAILGPEPLWRGGRDEPGAVDRRLGARRDPASGTPTEYAEFSVFDHQDDLSGIPVRIDCGTGDPFYRATQSYVDGFPDGSSLRAGFQPGAHDMAYWRRMAPGPAALRAAGTLSSS